MSLESCREDPMRFKRQLPSFRGPATTFLAVRFVPPNGIYGSSIEHLFRQSRGLWCVRRLSGGKSVSYFWRRRLPSLMTTSLQAPVPFSNDWFAAAVLTRIPSLTWRHHRTRGWSWTTAKLTHIIILSALCEFYLELEWANRRRRRGNLCDVWCMRCVTLILSSLAQWYLPWLVLHLHAGLHNTQRLRGSAG